MTRPTSWWWIRHAQVVGAEGRLSGQRDVECDTSDAHSLQALATVLPTGAVAVVSGLKRTRQTFDALVTAGADLPEPIVEPDFVEQSFGRWEGLSWAEMQARDPDVYAAFWENPTRNPPPGGESFAAQMRRTAAAIERLNSQFAGRDIVSISHGGTIRAAVAHTLGLTPQAAMAIIIDNLSLTRLAQVHDRLLSPGRAAWLVQAVNVPWPLFSEQHRTVARTKRSVIRVSRSILRELPICARRYDYLADSGYAGSSGYLLLAEPTSKWLFHGRPTEKISLEIVSGLVRLVSGRGIFRDFNL